MTRIIYRSAKEHADDVVCLFTKTTSLTADQCAQLTRVVTAQIIAARHETMDMIDLEVRDEIETTLRRGIRKVRAKNTRVEA